MRPCVCCIPYLEDRTRACFFGMSTIVMGYNVYCPGYRRLTARVSFGAKPYALPTGHPAPCGTGNLLNPIGRLSLRSIQYAGSYCIAREGRLAQ